MITEKLNMKDHKQDVSAWMKNSGIRIKKSDIDHKAFFKMLRLFLISYFSCITKLATNLY